MLKASPPFLLMEFGGGAFRRQLGLGELMGWDPHDGISALQRACCPSLPCEDTVKAAGASESRCEAPGGTVRRRVSRSSSRAQERGREAQPRPGARKLYRGKVHVRDPRLGPGGTRVPAGWGGKKRRQSDPENLCSWRTDMGEQKGGTQGGSFIHLHTRSASAPSPSPFPTVQLRWVAALWHPRGQAWRGMVGTAASWGRTAPRTHKDVLSPLRADGVVVKSTAVVQSHGAELQAAAEKKQRLQCELQSRPGSAGLYGLCSPGKVAPCLWCTLSPQSLVFKLHFLLPGLHQHCTLHPRAKDTSGPWGLLHPSLPEPRARAGPHL